MHLDFTKIPTSFEFLSTFQRRALIVVLGFSLLSALASVYIALRTIRDAAVLFFSRGDRKSRSPDVLFLRTQTGNYVGCLILSNLLISAAGVINFRWLLQSGFSRGTMCSVQAVLMQVGIWGTCWFTAAHGMHTLISFVLRASHARWLSVAIILVGWAAASAGALVPMRKRHVYGPAGISCTITRSHPQEIFFFGALPIFIGSCVSIAVYSIGFIVLHARQHANKARKLRSLKSTNRREKDPAEYNKSMNVITWSMLWFPLAFVLLLCPLCIVYIFQSIGHSVPIVLHVSAAACANLLGFVNVGLLCNIFRVIGPVSRARVAAETVLSFGHDASAESFHYSPHGIPSYESSHGPCNSGSTSSNHSQRSSWSSADSHTGLIRAEKAMHKPKKTKAIPPGLHIVPPVELCRQLDRGPSVTLPHGNAKSRNVGTQFVTVESPLQTVVLSPAPRSVGSTGDARHEPRARDEKPSFQRDAFGRVGVQLPSKPKASLAPDLSGLSRTPSPILPLHVTNKSAPLATARHGSPQAPSRMASDSDESKHTSKASYASTGLSSDVESAEMMHAYRVWPHSQAHEEEEEEVIRPTHLPAWHRRMTRASVWSQASGHCMTESPTEEQVEYWHIIADLLDLEAASPREEAGVTSKRATFARPVTLRIQPFEAGSKHSVHFSDGVRGAGPPRR